jgi:hypothetical protein
MAREISNNKPFVTALFFVVGCVILVVVVL